MNETWTQQFRPKEPKAVCSKRKRKVKNVMIRKKNEHCFWTVLLYNTTKLFLCVYQPGGCWKKKKSLSDKGHYGNADQIMNSYRGDHQWESGKHSS